LIQQSSTLLSYLAQLDLLKYILVGATSAYNAEYINAQRYTAMWKLS
jgi:hypothetical protein